MCIIMHQLLLICDLRTHGLVSGAECSVGTKRLSFVLQDWSSSEFTV